VVAGDAHSGNFLAFVGGWFKFKLGYINIFKIRLGKKSKSLFFPKIVNTVATRHGNAYEEEALEEYRKSLRKTLGH
jgi:hypothetical protein